MAQVANPAPPLRSRFVRLIVYAATPYAAARNSESISLRSAGVRFQPAAAALSRTCCRDVAPAMTDVTTRCASSQENASSNSVRPRDSANSVRASTLSRLASVRSLAYRSYFATRVFCGIGFPSDIFPSANRS